jgi:hypothetical protein
MEVLMNFTAVPGSAPVFGWEMIDLALLVLAVPAMLGIFVGLREETVVFTAVVRCARTVAGEIDRRCATSLWLAPPAYAVATSRSRSLSSSPVSDVIVIAYLPRQVQMRVD